jgi:rhamnogalacturonan endolyase
LGQLTGEIMTTVHTAASLGLAAVLAFATSASAVVTTPGKQIEKLNRGVVAIQTPAGPFISWRQLATDRAGLKFNVYRDGVRINTVPLDELNYTDSGGTATSTYMVRTVYRDDLGVKEYAGATWEQPFKTVPVQRPDGGKTPDGVAYTYEINDGTPADLDGDGTYEIIVKWQPTNSHDNSESGYTGNTLIDAYKLDGTRLWRIDLGRNIRAGAHYTTMVAYDLDGDNKAEIMLKTADATVDGTGVVIGSPTADYRNSAGYILSGPEYLTVFDGLTGKAMATTNYLPARGTVSSWGDSYGNRVDRFLGGVANFDGNRPSAIFSRGYYTRAVIAAWDWRDGKLTSRWVFDTNNAGNSAARGQGAHSLAVADVNNDGRDDIVYGAATIDSYGKLLYSTNLCHGDALHVGKFDPDRAGLQVFMVHETPSCYGPYGIEMHDAATGAILWGVSGEGKDVGRGVCADVDPIYRGVECWANPGNLRSVGGIEIVPARPSPTNFAVWWDGDLLRETLDNTTIGKWNTTTRKLTVLVNSSTVSAASNNTTKATPVLSADLFGDWREEVVWRRSDNAALLIFSTTAPTSTRLPTLMHNPQYRAQVASQNTGYNQPPNPSFYLGDGMGPFVQEPVHTP